MRFFLIFTPFLWLLCQGDVIVLREMYGEIRTPNFPDSYPSETEVTWNITVPEGFRIKLYFIHFDLEPSYLCEYDYAKVETDEQILFVFCGRESTDTEQAPGQQVIVSPGNFLSLTFRSDFSNEERYTGFDAHYSAVDVDECAEQNDEDMVCDHHCHNYIGGFYCSCRFGYLLHSDNRTCKVECSDNLYIQRSGIISSADFPSPYPKSSDCLYRIELEEGFVINLQFDDNFDIEDHPDVSCPYDYLKIKAGRKEYGPICGVKSPGRIETESNSVQILFHSDNSGENGGWRLSYTVTGVSCSDLRPPTNGKIEPSQSEYTFKEQVVVTCNPGYRIIKDSVEMESFQIECRKDGTWSNEVPRCQIVNCHSPKELENGYVTFSTSENSTTYQSTVTYLCQEPYYSMIPNITVCGFPKFTRSKVARISRGSTAQRGISPWIAMLSRASNNMPFCGGTLIGDRWIVTAAHCLHDELDEENVVLTQAHLLSPSSFNIILGKHRTSKIDDTEQVLQAKNLILHPEYNRSTFQNDVALLELSYKASLNDYVMPVCLPQIEVLPDDFVVVSGWGKQFLKRLPEALMEIEIPVVAYNVCEASYLKIGKVLTEDMICAGFKEGGLDACSGDSGGPMVTFSQQTNSWYLAGTVSWGVGCGESNRYGVYSSVHKNVDWIKKKSGVKQ
ncbi:hypothetical protein GDO78_001672 [Eleutherodactylus coqui]|uniref:Mannan-binding lectin serine protease 1 n=1 Tax=Eleutherodactylus coqui TaxID=57060 RepID=A0A8J6FSP2_ELECQ|nr:hypothetical protein GDO78_001672 [Eleutherodactylus coqui]